MTDYVMAAVCLIGGFVVAAFVAFIVYLLGYGVGLWDVGCQIESSQPHCVAQGWNGQTIHLEGKSYKVVPK